MKALKNKLLVFFVALLTLSMVGLGAVAFNSKTASASEIFATRNGAEIRLDGNNGMRFVTEISKSKISGLEQTYEGAIFEYGTFVMPADYIEGLEVTEETFFGEDPAFVYGGKVEGKKEVIHIPALLSVQESGDVDLIKGTVTGIKDPNLTREYIGIAYIKVTPVDSEPIYQLAGLQTEGISMINLATDTLDNDNIVSDKDYKASVDAYIAQYKAYAQIETVNYTVNYVYGDKVVAKTESVAFGSKTNASNVPTDNEEQEIDARYFYFNGEITNKTARYDGSTTINVDFTAKAIIEKAAYYGKYILNETKDGKVENTADLSVTLDNEEVVVIPASDIDPTIGKVSVVEDFKEFHVNKVTVTTASNVLMNAEDLANWVRITKDAGGTNWGHSDIVTLGADIDATDVSIYYYRDPGYHEADWGYSGIFDGNGYTISNLASKLVYVTNRATIKNLNLADCKITQPFTAHATSVTIDNCEVEFDATGMSEVRLVGSTLKHKFSQANNVTNSTIIVKNATESTKVYFASTIGAGAKLAVSNTTVTTNAGNFAIVGDQASAYDMSGAGTIAIESASIYELRTLTINSQVIGEEATLVSEHKYVQNSTATASVDAKAGYKFKGWYNGEELVSSELSYSFTMPSENVTLTAVWEAKEKVSVKANYATYILNESKNGRIENPEDLTVTYEGKEYVISKSDILSAELGSTYTQVITETEDSVVMIEVLVTTAIISTKEELTNIFYLTSKGSQGAGVPSNTSFGYIVLANDIDMTGVTSIAGPKSPGYTSDGVTGWGTEGVLDGQGHTIYNSPQLLGHQHSSGTIRNLGWVSTSNMLWQAAGRLENVYIDILTNSTSDNSGYAIGFIAKTARLTNTIIRVNNVGAKTSSAVSSISADFANCTNSYILTNSNAYATTPTSIVAPVVVSLEGLSVAQANAFKETANLAVWSFSNNGVAFNSARVDEKQEAWGKYVLNETKDGRVANTSALSYKGVEFDNATLTAGTEGGALVKSVYVNGECVRYIVKVARGVLNNAEEFSKMYYLSGDGKVAGNGTSWGGYYILNADVDVLTYPQVLNGSASSVSNYPGWGFEGTIDGNGHVVYNVTSRLFNQLGNWGATIKNISFLNVSTRIAINLGGVNFENCYFEFNFTENASYVFGQTVGVQEKGALSANFRNSVIVFNNLTGREINLINGVNSNETYTSTINYYNTILVTNSCNYAGIEIDNKPTVIALDGKYEGDLSGFNTSFWDISGNYPVAKNGSSVKYEKGFAWGGYVLNADASARVENTDGLTGEINGKDFTVSYDYLSKIKGSTGIKFPVTIDLGTNEYYTVNVFIANAAINTAKDWEKFELLACGSTGNTSFGGIVALNADIDIAGISPIMGSSFSTNYGFRGILEGNGRTLSNASTYIFRMLSGNNENTQGVMRNLTALNMTNTSDNNRYVFYALGTCLIENCYFQMNRQGTGNSPALINTMRGYGAIIKDSTFEVIRAGGGTTTLISSFNAHGPATDSVTFDNVRVITDNGYFRVGGGVTTEWDELEAGGTANRHARDFVIGAETPYVVNKPAA